MVELDSITTTQFYDHLLQSTVEGLLILDQHGAVISANEAATTILGYEPGTIIGEHYRAFWPQNLPPPEKLDCSEIHHNGTILHHLDRHAVPVTLSIRNIPNETAVHRLLSITDLAGVQQLNDALSQTQKLAGIGTLTASVAHELNTPISIITAACNNLIHEVGDGGLSEERLKHYVTMIEQSAWRCARIVGALRNYTVEDTLQMAVTDLNMIIEDAVRLVSYQFHADFNVTVETDLQPDLRSIVCDHNRITQILINLLTNARDAMQPEGGIIQIKSWMVEPTGAATPNGDHPKKEFVFSVRDTGHGLAPEAMEKIFNPFYTTKPNGRGTGLGLFIAKRIVTQHNGQIRVENNPDGGVTFTVTLPQKQPAASGDHFFPGLDG